MIAEERYEEKLPVALGRKFADISQLVKLRLSMLVVFSAVIAFVLASTEAIDWSRLIMLVIGGFLVTGAANGFNQVIEKQPDGLMNRTRNRPLPTGRMSSAEVIALCVFMGISGVLILGFFTTWLTALFGALSLVLYSFVYTPLKKKGPIAVYIGAIPGAMPPLLGWVAATGEYGLLPGLLFAVQFMWQFPHFWAIAWVADADYRKADYHLLPLRSGRNRGSAMFILVATLLLLPVSLLPVYFGFGGAVTYVVTIGMGLMLLAQSIRLLRTCEDKHARQVMFGSFIYLPVIQLVLMIDKMI
ncbi:protoheme IX farnesyltransferase [Anseongella ginsenosidimutans]|uniref:Protoheme IX farnesyltransferase n=1 Tax=Anseongella ginsenosidimutans TaxID=496056 RepID=A0A4R3KX66_9SPHI|nr:heme o synthase [Anseongella ginsenosidimutans]TCS90018.1 protoheme IX farnesyltransferase [Anseongella ginsenosidimutans]